MTQSIPYKELACNFFLKFELQCVCNMDFFPIAGSLTFERKNREEDFHSTTQVRVFHKQGTYLHNTGL